MAGDSGFSSSESYNDLLKMSDGLLLGESFGKNFSRHYVFVIRFLVVPADFFFCYCFKE
jgi:hypothetical protein